MRVAGAAKSVRTKLAGKMKAFNTVGSSSALLFANQYKFRVVAFFAQRGVRIDGQSRA